MGLLDATPSRLAMCWTLERSDGAGLALTSHDAALDHDRYRLEPGGAITPHSIEREAGASQRRDDIEGAVSSAALSSDDLMAGRWDGAAVALFGVDWEEAGERIDLMRGTMAGVEKIGDRFEASLATAFAKLDRPAGPETSPLCRARLGDAKCRVDLAGRRAILSVVSIDDHRIELDTQDMDDFVFGEIRWLSGPNRGLRSIIIKGEGSGVDLQSLPPFAPVPGDRVAVVHGCDKTFATCVARFDNARNFRGEPHLPGADLLSRYPGA
ncbi:DUF2163 domain-containing protein [Sphingomicrobium arenosum]|uniref:DUF2163 domain-containing protein n=1 Tax=Sphingomicrobium arenosum TaxID=2233861 RepID=UPI002240C89A|nr:DUF2163 domain-containing protein [Sphingomicrobium arenosum]